LSDNDQARQETLLRLAQSRADIRRLLEPEGPPSSGDTAPGGSGAAGGSSFPRSRTMKLLLTGRGMGTVGAVVGGLLLARPTLALRLLRFVPLEAVARVVLVKTLAAMRTKSR